ncbi:MAG: ParB/RepB/Spo0J family partition protein [bacterium]
MPSSSPSNPKSRPVRLGTRQEEVLILLVRHGPIPALQLAKRTRSTPRQVDKRLEALARLDLAHAEDDQWTATDAARARVGRPDLNDAMPAHASASGKPAPEVEDIPLDAIDPSPWQTREFTTEAQDLRGLADSIERSGVLQPILLRPHPETPGRYELVAGERRVRASRLAGRTTVPAITRALSDDEAQHQTTIENLQRRDLRPLEQGLAIQGLLDRDGWTVEAVAHEIGRNPSWVARRASLARLTRGWRDAIADSDGPFALLGAAHLERIARLPDALQDRIRTEEPFQDLWFTVEFDHANRELVHLPRRPTVRELQDAIDQELRVLSSAPWDPADTELLPEVGPCTACPSRSGAALLLWNDATETDHCLDSTCWARKLAAHVEQTVEDLAGPNGNPEDVGVIASGPTFGREPEDDPLAHLRTRAESPWTLQDLPGPETEGARPYVVLDGPEAGQVRWARPTSSARSTGGTRDEKPQGPTPLKVRRERLERRRLKRAIEILVDKIDRATTRDSWSPDLRHVAALAAAVGTDFRREHVGAGAWAFRELDILRRRDGDALKQPAPWDLVQAWLADLDDPGTEPPALPRDLWRNVWPVLKSRLRYDAHVDIERQWREVSELARLANLDPAEAKARADRTIPTPKSWTNLREDGRPKKKRTSRRA